MKLTFLILAVCTSALAQAPQTEESAIRQVRCDLLVVRLPVARALALQKELRDPKTIQQGIEKLLALVEKEEAELVDWPSVTTKSGNRAVVENIREVRYAVEFDNPQVIPKTPVNPDGVMVPKPTAPAPGEAAKAAAPGAGTPPGAAPVAPAKAEQIIAGAGPTTFETKNIGVILEVEPTIEGDSTIDMNLSPQHVSLIGYKREVFEMKGLYDIAVQQPIFDMQKVQTNITLKSGESQLMGFFHVLEPKNTVELHILTATILETKIRVPIRPAEAGR